MVVGPRISLIFVTVLVLSGNLTCLSAASDDRFPAADVDLRFPADCLMHKG